MGQGDTSVLSPFFRDLDVNYYFGWSTKDAGILNRTATLIRSSNPMYDSFQPEQVAIISWENLEVFTNTEPDHVTIIRVIICTTIGSYADWHGPA